MPFPMIVNPKLNAHVFPCDKIIDKMRHGNRKRADYDVFISSSVLTNRNKKTKDAACVNTERIVIYR